MLPTIVVGSCNSKTNNYPAVIGRLSDTSISTEQPTNQRESRMTQFITGYIYFFRHINISTKEILLHFFGSLIHWFVWY